MIIDLILDGKYKDIIDRINNVDWLEVENPNKKFELWFGCLGNGTTVCNKAVMENGDYKHIAHISPGGNIRFYVSIFNIPAEAMEKIKSMAKIAANEFHKDFERHSIYYQYGKILDDIPTEILMRFLADKRPLEQKLPAMRQYYYSIA